MQRPLVKSSLIEIDPEELKDGQIRPLIYHGNDFDEVNLSLDEIFAMWLYAEGDLEEHLPSSLKLPPPILRLPLIGHFRCSTIFLSNF